MAVSRREVENVVREVVSRLNAGAGPEAPKGSPAVDRAVEQARTAYDAYCGMGLDKRYEVVAAMREAAKAHVKGFAAHAVRETGMGRVEDKIQKNLLAIVKTPGPEILAPCARTGDHGLMLTERAPHGVIGAITPSTNPTETVINNAISMLSGGNGVVFNAHPSAAACSRECIDVLNEAVVEAGGPAGLVTGVENPSVETATVLMRHAGIALLCVTGGPGVVKAAMLSGKRVVAAGPGNPPVVIDETADLPKAARSTVNGASLDNNVICTSEKVAVVVEEVADEWKRLMLREGCFEVTGRDRDRLCEVIFSAVDGRHAVMNKECIGQDASAILARAGISAPDDTRLALVEVDSGHPLAWTEQLMPVLPMVRVSDTDTAIGLALEYEGGRRHTAVMHSRNIDKLSKMARLVNCSIFVKNGPSLAGLGMGGEGFTSFTIASPTGEGMTNAESFTRLRRCTLVDAFRIV